MKKYLLTIAILINGLITFAQTPSSFQYQAVLRDASGQVLANQDVEISIAILQGSASGAEVFTETHLVTTNNFGLANLQIGSVNPAGMEAMDWSAGPYFVQVSVDGTIMGISPLLSVPYALHALTVENDAVDDADADPTNEIQDISLSGKKLSISSGSTVVLPDEVNDADADPTNELQVLSIKGDTIFLSDGGYALLPTETDPQFSAWDKSTGITISESQISDLKHFTNEDESDPVFEQSLAKQITVNDTTRWGNDSNPSNELQVLSIKGDTIFLANGGYVKLPSETDPQFSAWDKSTGIVISESQISDLKHFTNADESDPVFEQSLAKQITANDTTRWGNDADPTNELQFLTISNDTIYLTNGGFVILPAGFNGNFASLSNIPANLDIDCTDDFDGQYSSLSGAPKNVSGFTNDAGYITNPNDADHDPNNELQDISLNGTDLSITDGSTVDLSVIQDGTGTDKQLLGWQVNNQGDIKLHISNGNSVTLPFIREEVDGDPSNELNTSVVLNGTGLEVTDAGGKITTDLSSLIDDADADPANELNTSVTLNGADLEVTDAGGTITTDLSSLIDDADADPTNELNTSVVLNGTDLEVTDAGGTITIDLSSLIDDADADPSNELQVISINNDTIFLEEDNYAVLPSLSGMLALNDSANAQIKNLSNPTDAQDAVTKDYIDRFLFQLFDLTELVNAGFSPKTLFEYGLRVGTLEQAGISETDLTNANLIGTVSDIDGNDYKWVKIGTQFWMAENLKTTKYANGDSIPDGTEAIDISGETEPKYWFANDDDLNNVSEFGRLYTWFAATDSRSICPSGWHLPSNEDWTTLIDYLGGKDIAGGKLKETGTTYWDSPNVGATNETGFSARGAGNYQGFFEAKMAQSFMWSSTPNSSESSFVIGINHDLARLLIDVIMFKRNGLSIRCIKN